MQHATITEFLQYYAKVKGRTKKVVFLITENYIDYSLNDKQFSIGDLARHIPLVELYFYLPIIKGLEPNYSGCDSSFAPDTASILELYEQAELALRHILKDKPPEFLREKIRMPKGEISVHKWLRIILEHEIRGQIYLLLSARGVSLQDVGFQTIFHYFIFLAPDNGPQVWLAEGYKAVVQTME